MIFLSIIIIVKNDPELDSTLKGLTQIENPFKSEIIVVDSSEKGRLLQIKTKYPKVKWYFYKIKKNKPTIPEQRNLGITQAKGNIIVFIDSGCIPDKKWLVNLVEPLLHEGEVYVAGKALSKNRPTLHDQVAERNKSARYLNECPTINLAFKKNLIKEIGYFNELFGYGEDVGFSWRVVDKGYKIRYQPNAVIYHNWGDWKSDLKRSFIYGAARAKLYKTYRHRLKYLFTRDITAVIYPIFIIGLPITIIIPIYPLLLLIPLIKNRSSKPIQVTVDHLVYGLGVLKELITNS
ncbi:MAG: glycosyltransferase [Patescibacteria group bacterium]|jgi:GT2 family glycosyltransferase